MSLQAALDVANGVENLCTLIRNHHAVACYVAVFLRENGIRRLGSMEIDEDGWWTGIWCRECKKLVEPMRRHYAIPMCHDCLPPPPPLPVCPEVFDAQGD